jgi:bifunctional UDP-N-acetylglucosamine pyrophosphorylase/glucosamine-1-phosphate N-acetyltransferase
MTAAPTLPFVAIVLAAGQGTRMKSARPKVLLPARGAPDGPLRRRDRPRRGRRATWSLVVGHGREEVRAYAPRSLRRQGADRGAGSAARHRARGLAVRCPRWATRPSACLILCGDTPLVPPSELRAPARRSGRSAPRDDHRQGPDPTGYGRILRDVNGAWSACASSKDASHGAAGHRRGQPRRLPRARCPSCARPSPRSRRTTRKKSSI